MRDAKYVERRDGAYRIRGTRVSLDSVVYGFLNGEPAESIAHSFPVLDLEEVYGAIAYYLAHQAEVYEYLKQARQDFEEQRRAARERNPELYRKLDVKIRFQTDPELTQKIVLATLRHEPPLDSWTNTEGGARGTS